MKLRFEAPRKMRLRKGGLKFYDRKQQRIRKYKRLFHGITSNSPGFWWNQDTQRWWQDDDPHRPKTNFSSHSPPVYSAKAFQRKLKQWGKYLPPKTEFILCCHFDNCNILGKTT